MTLTREKQKTLGAQYTRWGLEAVRADHIRNRWLMPPDIVAFTSAWITAEERRLQGGGGHIQILRASAIGLLAGTLLVRLMNDGIWPFT